MSWVFLVALVLGLGLAALLALARRSELLRTQHNVAERERARAQGSAEAQLQHPVIDLSRCLGCGTCVAACPEQGVLEIVHGQAAVVNGARCAGISACERECPVGAITVRLTNLDQRADIPVLTGNLEAIGSPGLFLAGEVTAHALIKTAIEHGVAVGAEVARRTRAADAATDDVLDLCIVGAGPAGLACSLEARREGLRFVTLDQESSPGGTVAKYPRHKLVLSQPVDLPLFGRLDRSSYTKEELMETWRSVALEHALPIRSSEVFENLDRDASGNYVVHTQSGRYVTRHVCLAIGRRGTPRKIDVPGESLPKVAYSLLDANSYRNRRILVVGGGDSAVEAALGLAEQPGNKVTLANRRESFVRIRGANQERLQGCLDRGQMQVLFAAEVEAIRPGAVDVRVASEHDSEVRTLDNDDVFVMAGGVPPFELLGRAGVSFDPTLRPKSATAIGEQGTGLARALTIGCGLSLLALAWAVWHADYYSLSMADRPAHAKHAFLRPSLGAGLGLGIAGTALIVVNLLYLLRRSPRPRLRFLQRGSLQAWMTSHIATGILAFLCATLHGAMAPRDTVGGHALAALGVLLVTGAIGRYFYSYVPRAANGRELELAEVRAQLEDLTSQLDGGRSGFPGFPGFGEHARAEVLELIDARQWRGSFAGRVLALLGVRRDLQRVLRALVARGRAAGIDAAEVEATAVLARRAHRVALTAAHFEDLRAVLSTWRYLHRWAAMLLVLLVALHVVYALVYGEMIFSSDGSDA